MACHGERAPLRRCRAYALTLVLSATLWPFAGCLGPLTGRLEEPPMDFSYPGERGTVSTASIVHGELFVMLDIPVGLVKVMQAPLRQVLGSVGVVYTPIPLQMFSKLTNDTLAPVKLTVRYYIYPYGSPEETVKRLETLRYGHAFTQLLQWEVDRHDGTASLNVFIGRVTMEAPQIVSRTVTRPYRQIVPTSPPMGDGMGSDTSPYASSTVEDDPCAEAESACVCAALKVCAWILQDGSEAYQCRLPKDFQADVSCAHCAIQSHCELDPVALCGAQVDTCACASSNGECYWNDEDLKCMPAFGNVTSCYACAVQDHCGPPELVKITPPPNSLLQRRTGKYIKLSFDRPIFFKGVQGDISVQCEGKDEPDDVPLIGMGMNDNVLTIDATSLANQGNRTCGLLIGDQVLRDAGDVRFGGLWAGEYSFILGDTVDPSLVRYDPVTATKGWNSQVITLTFDEPVFKGNTFSAALFSLKDTDGDGVSIDEEIADYEQLAARTRTVGRRVHLDLSGILDPEKGYAIEIARGALVDAAYNEFKGFVLGTYVFATGTAPGSIDNTPVELSVTTEAPVESSGTDVVRQVAVTGDCACRSFSQAVIAMMSLQLILYVIRVGLT